MLDAIPAWPSRLLARYAPLRRLGEGGMGEVWAAHDRLLARDVAVKVIRPDRRPGEARLQEEFALLASLDHPGVVHVLDVGAADGVLYMTSEVVEGLRLDHFLDTEPSTAAVTAVVWQLLEVLSWLHGEGVVHADIKPANILLSDTDTAHPKPVLIDFGLARVDGGGGAPLGGTLSYMAPELLQSRWARPSPRTDLYSLGVSLHPWAERHPAHPLSQLIGALSATAPSDRPLDADEALSVPLFNDTDGAPERRLGGRGLRALWGTTVQTLTRALAQAPGHHCVEVVAEDDADALLIDLAAALEANGQPCLRLSADQVAGAGVDLLERMVAAMTGADEALPVPEVRTADDHKELLDARAVALIQSLREANGGAPTLLMPTPSQLKAPGRYLFARLIEAGTLSRLVVTQRVGTPLSLGRGVEPGFTSTRVTAPDAAALERFVAEHGLSRGTPDHAIKLLQARAPVGARGLRLLLRAWAAAGAIVHAPATGWAWRSDVDVGALDVPALGALWPPLWGALPGAGQALIAHAHHLGGHVQLDQLDDLPGGPFHRALQGRLLEEGWFRGTADGLRLQPSASAALRADEVTLPAPTDAQRRIYVALLEAPGAQIDAKQALAVQLSGLARHAEAAAQWLTVAAHHDHHLDPGAAGAAFARASACHAALEDHAQAYECADQAARRLQVAGDVEGLSDAMAMAQEAAKGTDSKQVSLRLVLLEARVAVHNTRPEDALLCAERAEALIATIDSEVGLEVKFELALCRGTAHAQTGRRDEAVEALTEAAQIASERHDDHGEGRVTNNLGIAAYHARNYEAAADAWGQSAAAKERVGDLRGKRISESNRGLALRELGRLPEAIEATRGALADALRIGDRRGEATGLLALAQLHLDVGDPRGAQAHLTAAQSVPVASSMVEADGRIVGVRRLLEEGSSVEAAETAAALFHDAIEGGLPTIAREAWGLIYLASHRAEGGRDLMPVATEALTDDPAAQALTQDPKGDPLVQAAWLHATARSGDWSAVRAPLRASFEAQSTPLAPGEFWAIELLEATAKLVGDAEAEAAFRAAGRATLEARHDAAVAILGDDAPSLGALKRAFGLTQSPTPAQAAMGLQQTVLLSDTSPPSATRSLEATLGDDLSEPTRLADALGADLGAVDAWLIRLDDDARPLSLDGDADRSRWSDVAAEVIVGGAPYVAESEPGQLAALGMPLRVRADAPPVGALFLSWSPAREGDLAALKDTIEPVARWLALSLDRRVKTHELERLRAQVVRLTSEHEAMVDAHRQQITTLREALDQSRSELSLRYDYSHIVHRSAAMQKVLRTIDKVSDRDIPVLILGESGVGKEVAARAIHSHSSRAMRPFVAENCGAIPDELFESVFFGHVRGAFTGADSPREGLIAAAKGGTLFLDELGELPLHHQVKLLRVLQERRYRPVGGTEELEADFRLVAATNRDLAARVAEGAFREDLYYRLAVVQLPIPPLRERRDDLVPLAQDLLAVHTEQLGRSLKLSSSAVDALMNHDWPGNVRELDNELLRATVLCDGEVITAEHLSARVTGQDAGRDDEDTLTTLWRGEGPLSDVIERVEAVVIRQALERFKGQKAATARGLGLSRPGLDGKLDRYGIDAAEFKQKARRARDGETR
ncbi:MAG: sigma 54-interacting transcriptional regulator [Myxococcota bacterium]